MIRYRQQKPRYRADRRNSLRNLAAADTPTAFGIPIKGPFSEGEGAN